MKTNPDPTLSRAPRRACAGTPASSLLMLALLYALVAGAVFTHVSDTARTHASAHASPAFLTSPEPVESAPWYRARGSGTVAVEGPGCCDGMPLPGTFELDYELDGAGQVRVTRLQAALADMDFTFRFLIFEMGRVQLRCGAVRNDGVIVGNLDAAGNLTIPAGAATFSGEAFDTRDADGECGGGSTSLTLTNNGPVTGVLDPVGNRLTLAAAFTTEVEGHAYDMTFNMAGVYANRPPVARLGVEGPGLEAFAQGGCPAVVRWGNPPELVVEANDPAGLKMHLRSFSHDPEGGWERADLLLDQWFHARDDGAYNFIGEGPRRGPFTFEFGPVHRLTLKTTDRAAASSTAGCDFRVVDTTAPAVTPPAPAEVAATVAAGATPSTSEALRAFLKGASAGDVGDSKPERLAPLLGGAEVGDETLFAADPPGGGEVWHTVTFRFRDHFGNVGTADSYVRVIASGK
jgi:hypothetical protein